MISSKACKFAIKIELIMNELKVTFYLKKNETRADGTVPVWDGYESEHQWYSSVPKCIFRKSCGM